MEPNTSPPIFDAAALQALHITSRTSAPAAMAPAMALALDANFGSVERWRDDFTRLGGERGGASGSVLLCFLPREGRLVNLAVAGPTQALADAVPLLALEVIEAHADAFMPLIDWAQVYASYQAAVNAASAGLEASQDQIGRGALIDVRRRGVFEQAVTTLPGATWRDPKDVAEWAASLEAGAPVTVYCVYGHEVGRSTALRLRAAGIDARYLDGGIDAWDRAGKPLAAK